MNKQATIFCWGLLISFTGTLPPGVFTIAASQLASGDHQQEAWQFAGGAMIGEVIVVRLLLAGMGWLSARKKLFRVLEWMTICLLLLFAGVCFITAVKQQDFGGITNKIANASFLTGFLLSLVNPVHIPFWMGWATVLLGKNVLRANPGDNNWFTLGIGLGTLCGFWVFIDAGAYLLRLFYTNQLWVQYLLGLLLLSIAALQIRKMVVLPVQRPIVNFSGTVKK